MALQQRLNGSLALPAGQTPLTIGGTYSEHRLAGDYLISLETYGEYFPEQLDDFVMVKAEPGADPAAVQRGIVAATTQFGNVEVQDQTGFRDKYAGQVNSLLGLVTALLFMAILIALFGIINTLGLSIFERRRELGLLRAVGMSRRQVKRMIRWESVIIALLTEILSAAFIFQICETNPLCANVRIGCTTVGQWVKAPRRSSWQLQLACLRCQFDHGV